jgi:hypothetical protein
VLKPASSFSSSERGAKPEVSHRSLASFGAAGASMPFYGDVCVGRRFRKPPSVSQLTVIASDMLEYLGQSIGGQVHSSTDGTAHTILDLVEEARIRHSDPWSADRPGASHSRDCPARRSSRTVEGPNRPKRRLRPVAPDGHFPNVGAGSPTECARDPDGARGAQGPGQCTRWTNATAVQIQTLLSVEAAPREDVRPSRRVWHSPGHQDQSLITVAEISGPIHHWPRWST